MPNRTLPPAVRNEQAHLDCRNRLNGEKDRIQPPTPKALERTHHIRRTLSMQKSGWSATLETAHGSSDEVTDVTMTSHDLPVNEADVGSNSRR
jgi:hypothetical protein